MGDCGIRHRASQHLGRMQVEGGVGRVISSGYTVQLFKKADQKNAYNLLLLHTHMSIFNKKEGKNKSKTTKNIIYG